MRGYKFMKSDMTCRGFQYEVGKEYSVEGNLEICENGFHFCQNPFSCLKYYDNIKGDKKLFLVEALGEVITEDDKSVTDKIKIIEEIIDIEKFFDDNISKSDYIIRYDLGVLSINQKLSELFIEKHCDKVNWYLISKYQTLSEEFIEKHKDKVYWYNISRYQTLSEDFIEKHCDEVDWYRISEYQKLSEDFIEKLSEDFIEKYKDKLNWWYISKYQKLSESFIEKHYDKVDWYNISRYQKLSESFIKKYSDKVDW